MSPVPFKITIAHSVLEDLSARLAATRFQPDILGENFEAGINPAYHRELVHYWRTAYDWRAAERRINAFAQFRAEVGGTQLRFIHEPGRGPTFAYHSDTWLSGFIRPLPQTHSAARGSERKWRRTGRRVQRRCSQPARIRIFGATCEARGAFSVRHQRL
jgi:Epoxide hydrolase N terminus